MFEQAVAFLTASFPNATEFQAFFMALQGVMAVRNGLNKDGKMSPFHAFVYGVVLSFAGGLMGPIWMGNPTPVIGNDINMGSCILTFFLVNYLPMDVGYQLASLFPLRLVTTMGAQLFRTMGIVKFVNIAYGAFKDTPSIYYPTPLFGPIFNATMLGNMGAFFWKGFHGHLENGIPLSFQNGLFCSSLYHLMSNDGGFIGESLRNAVDLVPGLKMGLSHETFAIVCISLLMQSTAILQMSDFIGPSYNPFNLGLGMGKRKSISTSRGILAKVEGEDSQSLTKPSQKKKSKKKKAASKKKKN